ncbi:MAG: choice-of-anchor D domain-containing protein, partial [Pseudomonadota bacterium]|nr:choice-of-anchor D domain-containing protein [Pseudomonadota bacterium]
GWQGCSEQFIVTQPQNCTAVFEAKTPFTSMPALPPTMGLTIKIAGSGTVYSEPLGSYCTQESCQYTYKTASWIKLTPQAHADAEFIGWGGHSDCSDGQIHLVGNRNCIAFFKQRYPLAIGIVGQGNVSGQGIKCGQNCWQQYPEHTQVTLTATAGKGSKFSYWQGDCQGNQNPLTLTVQAPTRCSAYFEPVRQPHLQLSPKQYPNTTVEVDMPHSEQFELTNTGAQNLQFTQFSLKGSPAFSILNNNCLNTILAANARCHFAVHFQTQSTALQSAQLMIQSNDPQTPQLELVLQKQAVEPTPPLTITGKQHWSAPLGEPLTIELTLHHHRSTTQSYQLKLSEILQDKLISPLPTPLTISGERQITLSFEVQLPDDFNQHVTLNFIALNAPKHTVTQTIHLATEKPTQEEPQLPVAEKPTQAPETPVASPKEEPQLALPEFQPMTAATAPPCPSSGYIDFMCLNHGRTISHAVFGPNAYVAGGHLSGYIENAGMISQVTIDPDAVVSGGKLSGYIDNHGTLADFEFVGAAINGGQLAGTVYNHSPIDGVFNNVHLAAETYLQGGQLYGDIQGDQHAPPVLEQVVIQAGSRLQHLLIGEHVTWHEPVSFGTGVIFLNQ